MDNRFRGLAPSPTRATVARDDTTGLFWWAIIAIVLQFTLPVNVLRSVGYSIQIHPATFLMAICAAYAVACGVIPLGQRLREAPALVLFVLGVPILTLYSIYFAGFSGSTVFIESFWSAGILALLLEPATAKQRRLLGRILITFVIINILMALYESVTQVEFFPLSYEPGTEAPDSAMVDDFRAHAFYGHPLTASLVTSMAIFLLYDIRMRLLFSAPLFGLMLVGLLAFGGRTALGVTVLVSIAAAVYVLLTGLLKRRLNVDFVLAIAAAVIIIPPILAVIITQTTIADRIIHNLYYDDSAAVRAIQWDIFSHLTLKDWLFGISKVQLGELKYQLGLGGKETDIENFWILIFLDLGVFGFTVFVVMFAGFLVHLARYANTLNGWLLTGSALVIDSSSNSLGVWSNDLLVEVAFLIAISGFREHARKRSPRRLRMAVPSFQPVTAGHSNLMMAPAPLRLPNLRRS